MRRLLFVDDEPRILQGLRRTLHGQRREWKMSFASGAEAALAELAREPFDAVVTDMRMPAVDGLELLTRVQERHPQTLRVVLSGQTDTAVAARAARVAHQFVSKPSSPDVVLGVVERVCGFADGIPEEVRALVGRVDAVPVHPAAYARLREALQEPQVAVDELVEIVAHDPGMAAKLLQVVNSSFFGNSPQVLEVADAVRLVKPAILRELVLSAGVFTPFDAGAVHDGEPDGLYAHSVHVAEAMAGARAVGEAGCTHAAGLLHDFGKLVLAHALPGRYRGIVAAAREQGLPLHQAEEAELGATHAAVGAYLLGIWNLPDLLVDGVARHHEPPERRGGLAAAIRLAHCA